MHVPAATKVTVVSATVHFAAVADVKVTGLPEAPPVADIEREPELSALLVMPEKVML